LVGIAQEAGFPLIGPNCLGIYLPSKVDTFFLPSERMVQPDPGYVALVSLKELARTLMAFSNLVMDLEGTFESIDLNPVMCSSSRCVVADARIILAKAGRSVS